MNTNKGVAGGVVGVLDEAQRVLGEVHFKYQRQIGPFATQALKSVHALPQAIRTVEAMADAAHNLYVAIEAGATCVNSLHADLGKQLRAFHGSGPATGGGKEPDEDDDSDRDPCPGCFYRSCNGECMEVD